MFSRNMKQFLLTFALLMQKQGYYYCHVSHIPCLRPATLLSSRPEVFLRKGVLKICSKFTGEHSCRSVISIKLQSNFNEITLWHGCSPLNLLHIFRTPFSKNTSGRLLLYFVLSYFIIIPPEENPSLLYFSPLSIRESIQVFLSTSRFLSRF